MKVHTRWKTSSLCDLKHRREGSAVFRVDVEWGWVNNKNRQRNAPLLVAERAHERDAISRDQ